MITIRVDDRKVLDILGELSQRMTNLQPVMKEIGEDMVKSTQARFMSATAPDGTPWKANSPVTLERYLGVFANSHKKDGTFTKAGEKRLGNKKPLTGETHALADQINYQVNGSSSVSIGSPTVYAAMQQFGGTRAEFPNLWGDIPARPFLGVSDSDSANIVDIVSSYLAGP